MAPPIVSVITPCYNCAAYLQASLEALLAQTFCSFEVIFVDDGSDDGTGEMLDACVPVFAARGVAVKVFHRPHQNQSAALRFGLAHAQGKYLVWPDADDRLSPDSLALRCAWLDAHPDAVMVRSDYRVINAETGIESPGQRFPQPADDRLFSAIFMEKLIVCCGCYMLRAEAFDRLYPDRDIAICSGGQNYQMLLPPAWAGRCGYLPLELYTVVMHSDSHSCKKRTYSEDMERMDGLLAVCRDILHRFNISDTVYYRLLRHKRNTLHLLVAKRHNRKIYTLFLLLESAIYRFWDSREG